MLIDCYEAIERSSQRMLQAAQAQDWDGVARLEVACAAQIALLQRQAQEQSLSAEQSKQKTAILLRILRNDARIRSLMEPALHRLEPLLSPATQLH